MGCDSLMVDFTIYEEHLERELRELGLLSSLDEPTTLDNHTDIFIEIVKRQQIDSFLLGDYAALCVTRFGKKVTLKKLAECARTGETSIRQKIEVSLAFPPPLRCPELSWSMHREVRLAAKRLQKSVEEVLEQVVAEGLSLPQVQALGKPKRFEAVLFKRCDYCDSRISVEADSALAGEVIYCPVCLTDGQEHELGRLA